MRSRNGFGLVELLLTLGLAISLFFVSIKAWQQVKRYIQKREAYSTLERVLAYAKETAIARQTQINICPAGENNICAEDWSNGVIVVVSSSKEIILRTPMLAKPGQLIWHGWLNHKMIRYLADGTSHGYHGSFGWKQGNQEEVLLTINSVGHVR